MEHVSLDKVLTLVNGGGWQILPPFKLRRQKVTGMEVAKLEIVADKLAFVGVESSVSLSVDRIGIEMADDAYPRRIVFLGPVKVRQQRKKSEGGGWYEIEQTSVLLILVNEAAQAQYNAALAERKRNVMKRHETDRSGMA